MSKNESIEKLHFERRCIRRPRKERPTTFFRESKSRKIDVVESLRLQKCCVTRPEKAVILHFFGAQNLEKLKLQSRWIYENDAFQYWKRVSYDTFLRGQNLKSRSSEQSQSREQSIKRPEKSVI